MKKRVLIGVDSFLLIALTVFTLFYLSWQKKEAIVSERSSFEAALRSMEQRTQDYLENVQNSCNSWANYINGQDCTEEQATAFLREINSASDVAAEIVFPESMSDAASQAADGEAAVSFSQNICLVNSQGEKLSALLFLTVPVQSVAAQCEFPEKYGSAELSLIRTDGSYLLASSSEQNENFWETLSGGTSASRTEALRQEITEGSGRSFLSTDREGNGICYVCLRMGGNSDWIMVGAVPLDALQRNAPDWFLLGTVIGGVCLLLAVNCIYIRRMCRKLEEERTELVREKENGAQMLTAVSRELRVPMNVIVSLSGTAMKEEKASLCVKDSLKTITVTGKYLLTLMDDARQLWNGNPGGIVLHPERFSLADSVCTLVNFILPRIKEKDLHFEIHIHGVEYEYLYADELRFGQVLFHVLSNSVKYAPMGGKVIMDISEEVCVKDSGRLRLRCVVTDNGAGMSEELLKTLSEPVAGTAVSCRDAIRSAGLGLSVSRKIVELMGGSLEAENRSGGGSRFTVTLDLPFLDKKPEKGRLAGLKILLVDDDEVLLATAKETLLSLGGNVDCAASGAEAVELIAKGHETGQDYQVVILDWLIPGTDGRNTVKSIRAASSGAIPQILVSSYDWTDFEEEALAAGANGFIGKPLFRSTLYQSLQG